jgi:hypothetical protein
MRKIGQLRRSVTVPTRRRIALLVGVFGVVAATLSFGLAASGRPNADHGSANAGNAGNANKGVKTAAETTADTVPPYSGGHLMAADPNGGYWTVNWLGVITAFGGAPTFGSPALSGLTLTKPIVAMAATPDGHGYWLVGSDGGVFAYGDAPFYGSTGAIHLNAPIVGMAATPDGLGYWLVAADGGIFTYGDAAFSGSSSAAGVRVLGIIVNPSSKGGYTLVETDGTTLSLPSATASNNAVPSNSATPSNSTVPSNNAAPSNATAPPPAVSASSHFTTESTVTTVAPNAAQLASNCAPSATATATVDSPLSGALSSETGPGWIGGDATYSTELANGNEAFAFSDTLIGTAQASGAATLTGMPHNTELVGAMSGLRADYDGSYAAPEPLIPDTTGASGDSWQVAATYMENGYQLVLVNEFSPPVANSPFDEFTGHSGIAVLSVPSSGMPTLDSITPVPTDSTTQWGNAAMQSDGYTYIYANDSNTAATTSTFYGMKVARAPIGDSLNTGAWQYWNGTAWVSGEANAVPVATTNELTGVTPQQSGVGYVAVSVSGSVYDDSSLDVSYACSATGPWTAPSSVYAIPQVTEYHDEIAYMPTFHPELSSPGSLVVSYNVDSTDGLTALAQNVHAYQPVFMDLHSAP